MGKGVRINAHTHAAVRASEAASLVTAVSLRRSSLPLNTARIQHIFRHVCDLSHLRYAIQQTQRTTDYPTAMWLTTLVMFHPLCMSHVEESEVAAVHSRCVTYDVL